MHNEEKKIIKNTTNESFNSRVGVFDAGYFVLKDGSNIYYSIMKLADKLITMHEWIEARNNLLIWIDKLPNASLKRNERILLIRDSINLLASFLAKIAEKSESGT